MQFIVSAYYNGSNATFAFGPFDTEDEAETFVDRMTADQRIESPSIMGINAPALFGTGNECTAYPG